MPQNQRSSIRWFVISFIAVLIFVFFAFFADKFAAAELNLKMGDKELTVRTTQLKVSKEELSGRPENLYIDTVRGFSFELPEDPIWGSPKFLDGMFPLMKAKLFDDDVVSLNVLQDILAGLPMGKMLIDVKTVRLTSDNLLRLTITDNTTTEVIETYLDLAKKVAIAEGELIDEKDLIAARREILGISGIYFANEFMVEVYEKSKLEGVPLKITLPGFFVTMISEMGLTVDQIVADGESILAGLTLEIRNVDVNGTIKNFNVDRWMLLYETREYFYVVEIAYSPQVGNSIQAWESLKRMLDSFRIIT